jgi:hypothetical protein
MPYFTTSRLVRKYGVGKILWLMYALNSGVSQEEIAAEFKLSKARMSQICSKILRRHWQFRQAAQDAIDLELEAKKEELDHLRGQIQRESDLEQPSLKLIRGRKRDTVDQ